MTTPIDRRMMLTGLAGATAVGTPPALAEAAGDPHPAWLAECRRLDAAAAGILREIAKPAWEAADARLPPIWGELKALRARIADTPPRTLAGLQAQVELLCQLTGADTCAGEPDAEGRIARSLRATIAALSGRHPASNDSGVDFK